MATDKPTKVELTDFEKTLFHTSRVASKDITKPDFYHSFKPLWEKISSDIEELCKQACYPVGLRGSRIAVTTRLDKKFAYSPKANGYMLNIWQFFRNDRQKIYLNPLEFLACGFVHEENHRKFFGKYDMIGQNKETENFMAKYYFESEEMAILDEINFLNNLRKILPQMAQERAYVINSWSDLGLPDCEITVIGVCPPIRLDFELLKRKNVLDQMRFLQSKKIPENECEERNSNYTSNKNMDLLNALKLTPPLASAFKEILPS